MALATPTITTARVVFLFRLKAPFQSVGLIHCEEYREKGKDWTNRRDIMNCVQFISLSPGQAAIIRLASWAWGRDSVFI